MRKFLIGYLIILTLTFFLIFLKTVNFGNSITCEKGSCTLPSCGVCSIGSEYCDENGNPVCVCIAISGDIFKCACGKTYFADKCDSGICVDREDNICRSSDFRIDCTADENCNQKEANSSWVVDSTCHWCTIECKYNFKECKCPGCKDYCVRETGSGKLCYYKDNCTGVGETYEECPICIGPKTADCTAEGCKYYACEKDSCGAECHNDLHCIENPNYGPGYFCDFEECKCKYGVKFSSWLGITRLNITLSEPFFVKIYVKNEGLIKDSYDIKLTNPSNVEAKLYSEKISNVIPNSIASTNLEIKSLSIQENVKIKVSVSSAANPNEKEELELTIQKMGSKDMADLDIFSIILLLSIVTLVFAKNSLNRE